MKPNAIHGVLAAVLATLALVAGAAGPSDKAPTVANAALQVSKEQDQLLRKNLAERLPSIGRIDEISRTPMPGLFEVRIGTDLFYTDADGAYLLQGQLIDTKARKNLTEERLDKLLAVDFDTLPTKDAFVMVRGNGKRKLAVFEDPNCPYCKKFERDLQKVDNVTVYMYLYPILGPDSTDKSRNIWCAKDKAKAWQDYMLRNEAPSKAEAGCDLQALSRNIEFGKKHKITGTPTLIFTDGTRVPGAIGTADIERMLAAK
ncbi:DsbC family protein [Ramlibacter monticola]|uniref:Thiol:disulfide interchange protein n=1 Tax=Ramlibacter monticola TaxID=1926872 RepID=A0A936Z4E1_9BURK|nr:DsbC family protein [Ramlibacter monticola]MBL0393430.1 DsbC family protein [Ramlibacter monticola]